MRARFPIWMFLVFCTLACAEQEQTAACSGVGCSIARIDAGLSTESCTAESEETREGQPCLCGGVYRCVSGQIVCQGGREPNQCGGCGRLSNQPGAVCGACQDGLWVCAGDDSLRCHGATPDNPCGGCEPSEGVMGEECGLCGVWACDNQRNLVCNDPGPTVCKPLRLIALGDAGEGNEAQYQVARGVQARCDRAGGCDGMLMLGDNIYDTGAESPTDQQLTDKIDMPYRELKAGPPPPEGEADERERMIIYVTLGNHDLGGGLVPGSGTNLSQLDHYIDYAAFNDWFYYPSEFWTLSLRNVQLISLHTNPLAYNLPDDRFEPHADLVDEALVQAGNRWTIAFGHHPYRSNGKHGNAGAYEGFALDNGLFGGEFRRWFDRVLCNRVDFYFSGHDHNRQWISRVPLIPNLPEGSGSEVCHIELAVSGAGAKLTDIEGRGNLAEFEDDTKTGFLFLEFYSDRVNVEFCDQDGQTDWTKTIRR